jgi:RimJ/RimL family protein N-acetyltransferase
VIEVKRPPFPDPLETERLLLRSPQPGDGIEVNQAIRESYADLHEWMDWATYLPDVEETEQRKQEARARFLAGEDFQVHAYLKTTYALVAVAALHPLNWSVPSFEIGYWGRCGYQGQGYVSETVRALTRVALEVFQANRIQICCDERNLRSRRVAKRAGYELEAVLKNDQRAPDGRLRNTLVFAVFPVSSA